MPNTIGTLAEKLFYTGYSCLTFSRGNRQLIYRGVAVVEWRKHFKVRATHPDHMAKYVIDRIGVH